MTLVEFDKIVDERIKKIKEVLQKKGDEYATGDRMHNFKRAGELLGCTPEKALLGFLVKHIISVIDLINGKPLDIDEKIGDCINYFILLEALLKEVRK